MNHLQVDETAMMFTQHAIFAEPLDDDDIEEGEDHDTTEQQAQDTDSDTQDDPAPDWTVPPASTFLRFYSDEPEYLKTNSASEISQHH